MKYFFVVSWFTIKYPYYAKYTERKKKNTIFSVLFHILRYISNCSSEIPHSIFSAHYNRRKQKYSSESNKQFIKTMVSPFERHFFVVFFLLKLWLNGNIIAIWNCTKMDRTRMSKPYTWPLYELKHYRNSLVVVWAITRNWNWWAASRQMVKLHATMRIIEILRSRTLYAFECHRNSHEIVWHTKPYTHVLLALWMGSYEQMAGGVSIFVLISFLLFVLSYFKIVIHQPFSRFYTLYLLSPVHSLDVVYVLSLCCCRALSQSPDSEERFSLVRVLCNVASSNMAICESGR